MSKTYFGFALADSMFANDRIMIQKNPITAEEARERVGKGDVIPALNPSHAATIAAMGVRYGIEIAIPEKPPRVALDSGDSIIVMGVRGLPRLTDRHEYTNEEIEGATFVFSMYSVQGGRNDSH